MLSMVQKRTQELLEEEAAKQTHAFAQKSSGAEVGVESPSEGRSSVVHGSKTGDLHLGVLDGASPGVWGIGTSEEVAVLLSGGVDSSVSLKLCQQQGLKARAFYLKIWLEDGEVSSK